MLARLPRSAYSLDPLIAEAKRRARRRRWMGLLAVVVIAAAAATLELRWASGSGLAAGGRPVTHIVIRDVPSTVYVNLKTGHETVQTQGEEMWFTSGRHGWHRIVSTAGGRPVGDQVWQAQYTRSNTQAAAVDRFYSSLGMNFRAALRSGRFQLAGGGTFAGHHVDWVNVLSRWDRHWYGLRWMEVGIDARTYKPILLRDRTGERFYYERVLLAKAIAYNPADFETHGPKGPSVAPRQVPPGFAFGSPDATGSVGTVVRRPWLTAGPKVAGLELRAVRPFTIRRSKHHFGYGAHTPGPIHGLALVYAPSQATKASIPTPINLYGPQWQPGGTPHATTIYEVPRASRVPPWSSVKVGSIELQRGLTTRRKRVIHTLSIGYLRRRGLFITIRTSEGPRAALQVARALHAAAG